MASTGGLFFRRLISFCNSYIFLNWSSLSCLSWRSSSSVKFKCWFVNFHFFFINIQVNTRKKTRANVQIIHIFSKYEWILGSLYILKYIIIIHVFHKQKPIHTQFVEIYSPLRRVWPLFFQRLVQYIHQLFKLSICNQNTSFLYLRFLYSNQNVL